MKKIRTILFCLIVSAAHAQNSGGIRVTTTLHEDGTKTVITTDTDQHTSESVTYGAKEKVVQKVIYVLNENNMPASGTVYTPTGKIVFRAIYKRDGLNRVTEEIDSTPEGNLLRRFVYEYGADGKVAHIRAYDANGNELHQTQSPAKKDEHKVAPLRRR